VIDGIGLDNGDMPFSADTTQYDAAGGYFTNRMCLGGHAGKPESEVKLYVRRVEARAQRCVAVEKTEESMNRAIVPLEKVPGAIAQSAMARFEAGLRPILYYTDHYEFPLPEGHRFPIAKYRLIREFLEASGRFDLRPAPLAEASQVELAHDPDYVRQFVAGTLPREKMRRIGFPWSEGLLRRTLASVGATLAASEQALGTGFGGTLAGGTHHAFRSEGSGYCVFNDIAVAIEALRRQGKASRFAVVDLDVHQGDGTAQIFENDPEVLTFSMHGGKNFPFRKQRSKIDVELEDETGDDVYLEKLASVMPTLLEFGPEFVFYQSGVDPLDSDRLGRLAVTMAGLRERDRMVFHGVLGIGCPIVVTLGGGYSDPISRTAEAHAQTFLTASDILDNGFGKRLRAGDWQQRG
jgi:acetoin utilization deacetylase AcuC-like enzyme